MKLFDLSMQELIFLVWKRNRKENTNLTLKLKFNLYVISFSDKIADTLVNRVAILQLDTEEPLVFQALVNSWLL